MNLINQKFTNEIQSSLRKRLGYATWMASTTPSVAESAGRPAVSALDIVKPTLKWCVSFFALLVLEYT